MKKVFYISLLLCLLFSISAEAAQTRATLRSAVREYLHETDEVNSNYTSTQINDALNFGMDFLSNTLPESSMYKLTKTTSGVVLVAGSESVSLPTSFKKIISVRYHDKPALPIKFDQWFAKKIYASVNDPQYAIFDNMLYLYPASTGASATYEIMYVAAPDYMDSDSETITASFDESLERILCLIASSYILKIDSQVVKAKGYDDVVASYISSLSSSTTNTNSAEPNKAGAK